MNTDSKQRRRRSIGVILRMAADARGLGPTAIADGMTQHGVQMTRQAVSNYLAGTRAPDGPTLRALAAVLSLDAAQTRAIAELADLYIEVVVAKAA